MDVFKRIRNFFPISDQVIYLNNAAESPLCIPVKERLDAYLSLSMTSPHKKPPVRESIKSSLSGIFGGHSSDYALVGSTGMGIGTIAAGFKWQVGDNVVIPEDEHWNNTYPWYQLKNKGEEIRLVPVDSNGKFKTEDVRSRMDDRTRILSMAAVRYNSGFRPDLKAYSKLAHDYGAFFVVDGIQGAGVVPIDVERDGIDVLCCAAFKWLYGFPGTGFMYVSPSIFKEVDVILPGMFSGEDDISALRLFDDARRFETGTIAYPFYHAWSAGLDLIISIGIEGIHARILQMTDLIITGLKSLDITIMTPYDNIHERSAIIVFDLGSTDINKNLHAYLSSQGILISIRNGKCRVSPAIYNTEEEIEAFLSCIKNFMATQNTF